MPHSPTVSVLYNSQGWESKLSNAIQSGNLLKIRIKGSIAAQVCAKVEAFTVQKAPAPPGSVPIPYPKLRVSAFLVAVPKLLALVLQALTFRGYTSMTAAFDKNGAGSTDDELVLRLS